MRVRDSLSGHLPSLEAPVPRPGPRPLFWRARGRQGGIWSPGASPAIARRCSSRRPQRSRGVEEPARSSFALEGRPGGDQQGARHHRASAFEADARHELLGARADALEGCTENSPKERNWIIAEAVEAYEAKRW